MRKRDNPVKASWSYLDAHVVSSAGLLRLRHHGDLEGVEMALAEAGITTPPMLLKGLIDLCVEGFDALAKSNNMSLDQLVDFLAFNQLDDEN